MRASTNSDDATAAQIGSAETPVDLPAASEHNWLAEMTPDAVPAALRPVLEFAQNLRQLDELLIVLEAAGPADHTSSDPLPDAAAIFGTALSIGLAIGHTAAEMRHEAIAGYLRDQTNREAGGKANSWKHKYPKEAKLIVFEVLRRALADTKIWSVAIKLAGVQSLQDRGIKLPDPATIRRLTYEEFDQLLSAIDRNMRTRSMSLADACQAVAQARDYSGRHLSPDWLKDLWNMAREGQLPGQGKDWLTALVTGRVSKELNKELGAMNAEFLRSSGRIVDAAFDTYESE